MNCTINTLPRVNEDRLTHLRKEELEEQVAALVEWKKDATLQLEYFRNACLLYKLCDVDKVNELLNA